MILLRIVLFMGFIMNFSYAAVSGVNVNNSLMKSPLKNQLTGHGNLHFEWSEDGRNILFFAEEKINGKTVNKLVGTYEYSDGPVELQSFFF